MALRAQGGWRARSHAREVTGVTSSAVTGCGERPEGADGLARLRIDNRQQEGGSSCLPVHARQR